MLRDGGPADREIAGELADWLRAVHQAFENRSPGRIAQRIKLSGMLVSNH
jgi:hypothetical protein